MLSPWLLIPEDLTAVDTPAYDPAGEVVELCRDLLRIDTSNYGDDSGPGERPGRRDGGDPAAPTWGIEPRAL